MLQVEEMVILLLASLAILINTFGLVSVLRNYRRLRQRMYLFVISLTIVNVIIGIAFMVDVIVKISGRSETTSSGQSECANKGLIVMESLKAASVILSSLNTLTLTYALHKRTTRMGRHRSGTSSASSAHTDGASMPHIPAFDTMLRVLSLGSSQQNDKEEKSKLKKVRGEKSSYCESSFTETSVVPESRADFASLKEEEYFRIHANGFYRGQNSKADKAQPKSQSNYTNSGKRMGKIAQMLVPKGSLLVRRGSNIKRSSQPYIGRHSISVISVRTTVMLLSVIWLTFITMWITPIFARSQKVKSEGPPSLVDYFVCPVTCAQESFPSVDLVDPEIHKIEGLENTLAPGRQTLDGSSRSAPIRIRHNRTNIKEQQTRSETSPVGDVGVLSNYKLQENQSSSKLLAATFSSSDVTQQFYPCCGCSNLFYPISEVHVMVNCVIIVLTWLYMSFSSLRLLWLRKHSNNVFVRYSALWRFLLFTSLFYLIVYTPYVSLCIYDIIKQPMPFASELVATPMVMQNKTLYGNKLSPTYLNDITTQTTFAFRQYNFKGSLKKTCFLTSKELSYVTISSSFILCHSAAAPLFYIMRLLGCRRLLTGF